MVIFDGAIFDSAIFDTGDTAVARRKFPRSPRIFQSRTARSGTIRR